MDTTSFLLMGGVYGFLFFTCLDYWINTVSTTNIMWRKFMEMEPNMYKPPASGSMRSSGAWGPHSCPCARCRGTTTPGAGSTVEGKKKPPTLDLKALPSPDEDDVDISEWSSEPAELRNEATPRVKSHDEKNRFNDER